MLLLQLSLLAVRVPTHFTAPRCSPMMATIDSDPDSVWAAVQSQAAAVASPILAPYLKKSITSKSSVSGALATLLASKIASDDAGLPEDLLATQLFELLSPQSAASCADLTTVLELDPAAPPLLAVFMHFKGFLGLQTHRAAASLWARGADAVGARQLALLLQGRASELFGIDIHPGASIGPGVFIDHATGVVIGETASIGSGCYILHGVTLGSTGKRDKATGRRHPSVGDGCVLGSGSSLLGPIEIGDGATIGAGATVTKSVEAGASVIDTSYTKNKVLAPKKKKS